MKFGIPSFTKNLSAKIQTSAPPTVQISMKFGIRSFTKNLSGKIQIWLQSDKNI
jgi:hypothetical protein